MSLSVFDDKMLVPDDGMLAAELADSLVCWNGALDAVGELPDGVSAEWKFYSKAAGWSLVVKSGKRTILYLIPQEGFFKVAFVYGDKAADAALLAGLPKGTATLILEAKKHTEGRSFMVDVRDEADFVNLRTLIRIKASN